MLGVLQAFIGVGGAYGGYSLIADPSGANLGITTEPLAASPFESYLIPGIILFLINGIGQLVGSFATFMRWRRAGLIGIGTGALLVIWIGVQIFWLGLSSALQTSFLVLGLLEILQGYLLHHNDAQVEE
jgi:hypothetical protein